MTKTTAAHHSALRSRLRGLAMLFLVAGIGLLGRQSAALGSVILLTNRSPDVIPFKVEKQGGGDHEMKLYPQDVISLIVQGPCRMSFDNGKGIQPYLLKPNTIYFFGHIQDGSGTLDVQELGLTLPSGKQNLEAEDEEEVQNGIHLERTEDVGTLTVKIMVDHKEPALQQVWEKRLRKRMAAASKILEETCRLKLDVVEVGRWNSEKADDFEDALKEFEAEAIPKDIDLVIGFTSRYVSKRGRIRLGGTYGLFRRHILIREQHPNTTAPERLEVLLHEIGHTLGAVHSPEDVSVMRPNLADDKANAAGFRIAFDPVNALAMNLVSESWRFDNARKIEHMSLQTRLGLMNVYSLMSEAMPGDNSTRGYLNQIGRTFRKSGPRLPRLITDLPPP